MPQWPIKQAQQTGCRGAQLLDCCFFAIILDMEGVHGSLLDKLLVRVVGMTLLERSMMLLQCDLHDVGHMRQGHMRHLIGWWELHGRQRRGNLSRKDGTKSKPGIYTVPLNQLGRLKGCLGLFNAMRGAPSRIGQRTNNAYFHTQ